MTEKTEKFTRKDSSGRVTTTEITTTESMEGLSPKMKELLAKATTSEKPTRGGSWSKVVKSEVITTSRTSSLASDQPMSTITSTEVITRKDSLGDIERKGSAKKPAPLDLNKKGIRQITSSEIATFEAHDKKAVNFQASEQYKMALEQPSYISASEFQPPPDSDEEEYDEERLLLAERDLAENAPWKMIQQNTFTRWCNEHLKVYNDQNLLIKNLATDLKDGIRLARLVESLSQKRIKGITTRAKIHIQHMGNITSVLEFLKKEQIDLVNIDSQHINEGHMKLILGLIWKLILHYSISLARWDDEDELSPRKTGGRARLLDWMQANVTDHYGGPPIRNFTKDWNDGIRLGALVDSKAPGLCPNWDEWQPTNAFNNANTAIDLAADWLDVAKIIEPDEIINPNVDEKSLMTYLSQFPLARPKDGAPLQPFCKPHRARAFGLGIEYKGCVVGQPAQFRVETYGAGQGELQIRVLDPSNQQVECNVQQNNDHYKTYDCVYYPKSPGLHTVEITWARQLIKDAPFKVNVGSVAGDSRKCRAEGPGLQLNGLVAGIPTEFNVYTEGAGGSGLVDSSITDPNGRKDTVQMRIERNPNNVNQYNVKYLPTVPGPHNIKVTFGGTHVPGSPFTVNISPNEQMMKPDAFSKAVDPRKVRVTGRGVRPKGLRVNEPAVFTIYPSDAGEATVSVQILGPGGVQVSCQKQQLPGTNDWECVYYPQVPGPYKVLVQYGGQEVPGSPFNVMVDRTSQSRVIAYGPGLHGGRSGLPATFTVDTRGEPDANLGFSIEGPSEAQINAVDNGDGSCKASYLPVAPGDYIIHISCNNEDINGSPYCAKIQPSGPDTTKVKVTGPGIQPTGVSMNKPTEFDIDITASQPGEPVEVLIVDKDGDVVEPIITESGPGHYKVQYTPTKPQKHTVYVIYSGVSVDQSPYQVNVDMGLDLSSVYIENLEPEAFIDGVHDFIVNARNKPKRTGNEEVRVIISAPSGRRTAAKVRPQGDGTYDIQYVLKELGPHTFEVTFQGAPVPNSPFTVNAKRGRNVHRIEAVGEGLRQGVVGKPAGFMVITKNAGPGSLGVFIEGPSEAKTTFKDNKDGTCNLDYLPTKPGDYNITIKYEDEEIPGSPFVAHISDGSGPLSARADPGAVRVLGPSLRPGGEPVFASEPQHFSVDARQAGRAPVQCRVVDPTQQEVPGTRVTDNYDGTYGVQWTPEDAGPHSVNVLFDGQPVPESPFNVNAQPTGNAGACVFSGLKPTVPVHQDTPFTVDARNAGRGNITCSADGPDGRKYPVVVNNNGNGTFTGHFTPNLPGNYKLNIKFGGRPISNSPFTTQATPGGSDSIDSSMISPSFYQPQQSYPGDAPYSPISPSQVAPNQAGKGYPGPGGYPQQGGKAPQTAPGSQPGPGIYPSQGGAPSKTAPGAYPGSGPQTTPGSQPGYGYPNQGGAPPKTAPGTYPSQTGPVPQTPTGAQPGYSYPQSAGTQPGQGYPSQGSPLSPGKAAPMSPGYPNQVGPAAQGGYPSQAAPGGYPSQSVPYNQGARPVNEPLMTQSQPPSNLQSPRGAYPPGRMEEPISAAKSPGNVNSPYFPRDNVPYDENISPISQKPQHTPFSPRSGIPVKPLGKDTPIGAMTPFDVCIQVDTSTPSGKITAEVVNPSGKRSSPEVVINPDGTISVKHTPTEVGKHDLYVSYNGANIQGSPFQFFVDALSPGRATAYGPGLTSGIVNRPCFFNVCSKSPRGPDGLRVSVQGPSRAEVQCTDNGDGSVTCQYLPTVAGDYTIEVSCNNQTVSGSPFLAKIQDPYADVRTKRIPMGTPSQVMLTISEPNLELLNATIRRPTGIEEKVTLTKMPTGSIGITFTPKEAGEHLVNVFKNGHHIPNSPFTISVSPAELGDANKVRVWGPGVEKGRVNQTERFFVDMKEAGYSNLSLSIEGPSQASLDCADKEPGVCEVTYMPTEAGEYRITVKYGDRPVPNSPFVVNVEPSGEVFSSEKMRPMQYNPAATSIGSECELTLRVPDASPNEMQAQVLNPHGQPENARIGIDKDGKFTVSFIPQMQGVHLVHVYHRGREIYGSPFPFTVGPTPEEELGAPLVKAYGPGLQFAEAGKPAEFVVMTREAGGGSLSVAVEGPAKTDIDLQDNKDGSSNIIYYPTLPGEYKVNIKFNEQHIPNSPFTVTCHPNLFPPFSRPSAGLLPNQPSSFVVSLPNVYSVNEIDARLYTPLNTEIPCQLQKLDNQGNYSIKFTPTVTGEHRVDAKVWGAHIPGSPFYFKVGDIRGDPTRVFADGEGLYRGTTGRSCEFIVNTCNAGKGTLQVTIDGPSRVTMDCVEVEEGYKVSYTPLVAGQYDITVKYAGPYHINGSPFRAIITGSNIMGHAPQRDHADLIVETVSKTTRSGVPLPTKDQPPRAQQVQCRGPGLKRADLGRPTNFIVDSSKAGNSMLLVGVKGPYHPVEEIVVKHLGNNEFDIKYRPVETGSHSVIVKWNDEHVPGSPFNVLVV